MTPMIPKVTDDLNLARRCAESDRIAGEELYRRFSPRILSLCLRYCENREEAEDTMHDAFVKILESIHKYRYDGEGSLYRWMSRVSVNLCFDSISKRRRLKRSMVENFDLNNVLDEVEEIDAPQVPSQVLRTMIDELPPMYATVFKLYVVDELSHAEIGKLLGIKEKSSSSNLARARVLLNNKIRIYCKNR